jgi:alkanesulfonate monooxygenase SsuD/methylene tetrahydromethanopterin reductase-like flavin-dependent oxidoreductase (luciferase family)
VIGERWYDVPFERPLQRIRETVDILRATFEAETIDYEGELFDIGPYPVQPTIDREVPIYNAALGPANCRLTGQFCDGGLPTLVSRNHLADLLDEVRTGARRASRSLDDIVIAPYVMAAIGESAEEGRVRARKGLARAIVAGYKEHVDRFGFGAVTDEVLDRWERGNRDAAAAVVTAEIVDAFTIAGTAEGCRRQLERYREASGADTVNVMPSFTLSAPEIEHLVEALGPT